MIDYEMYSRIHDCHERQGLTITQTARTLGLDPRTVAAWLARPRYQPRCSRRCFSIACSKPKQAPSGAVAWQPPRSFQAAHHPAAGYPSL